MSSKSPSNPFLEEEEVDDFEFLSHPKHGQQGYMLGNESNNDPEKNEWQAKQQLFLEERRRIEERTLQSTNSSLGMLYESEQVGILTAEELVRQREQLQNVEQDLDKINSTMRISQKHINSIKSMFGGIKNYFSRGNTADLSGKVTPDVSTSTPQPSGLQETVGNLRATEKEINDATHPALRLRGIGSFDEEETDFPESLSSSNSREKMLPTASQRYTHNIDEKLDKNLEFMSLGLGRLKNLAIGLNEEMEDQNDILDRIHTKADRADESLEYQNRQIKRILKK